MRKKARWRIGFLLFFSLLVLLILPGFYNEIKIQRYELESDKISRNVRLALIADLHSSSYGDRQDKLLAAIKSQNPDVILYSGDIFDEDLPNTNVENLLQQLVGYPSYYVTGNHEYWAGEAAFNQRMELLERYGVHPLHNEAEYLTVKDQHLNIVGVKDPDYLKMLTLVEEKEYPSSSATKEVNINAKAVLAQELAKISVSSASASNYTVLLSHRPNCVTCYENAGFEIDLVLSGHNHGGQWRIPGLVNGLYTPEQGLFPDYAGGKYRLANATMIVSRGLAKDNTWVPRIYNRPELVIIDLS